MATIFENPTFLGWQEKPLVGDQTIPLGRMTLDDPVQFVHYNPATLHRTLDRFGHYRIYSFDTKDGTNNYCYKPPNIWLDADNTLMLYAEFGEPTTNWRDIPDGLAVCSFDQSDAIFEITPEKVWTDPKGATLDIAQFQTTIFDHYFGKNEDVMFSYLGFIKYKKLFSHFVEQLAWKMHHVDSQPIAYVSIPINMPLDNRMAWKHIEFTGEATKERAEKEIQKIRNEREAWAKIQGYTSTIGVATRYNGSHSSYAKPITDIQPDPKLQQHIGKLQSPKLLT